ADILADMKRSNAAESDHRNIMTPEFRAFCIASREHVACCATFLVLFVCAYEVVRRACSRPTQARDAGRSGTRRLVVPYASVFRARQISLVAAAAGLAAAAMTAVLTAVTVALANAMEHGDMRSRVSWRTWLLPTTLLAPGDAEPSLLAGPQAAHAFPPLLRRLWLYQSIVSVGAAAVVLPLGVLFEGTSRRAPTRQRLFAALVRWLAFAACALAAWEAACRRSHMLRALGLHRPLSADGATMRYSIHYVTCVFGLLPVVLAIVPRGTWALFGWLRSCVGQRRDVARAALLRFARLQQEQARIQRQLRQAIGSWKWEQFHDALSFEDLDGTLSFKGLGDEIKRSVKDQDDEINQPLKDQDDKIKPAGLSSQRLPPAHPGLARRPAKDPRQFQTVAVRRSGASAKCRPGRMALSTIQLGDVPELAEDRSDIDGTVSPHSPILYYSDTLDSSDDGLGDSQKRRIVERTQRRLRRAREREMQDLSRKIKSYHAQLLFIGEELARINASGILEEARSANPVPAAAAAAAAARGGSSRLALAAAKKAAAILVMVAAAFCWLLVVLQVVRGALSAIFVGEPDLTSSFTYFMPALIHSADAASKSAEADSVAEAAAAAAQGWASAALPPLVTACQLVSGALLFVVVLFGVLSMGSSVEGSVLPARAAAASYAEALIRARLWAWLPRTLLPAHVRAAIDPTPAQQLAARDPQCVAGNTSRAFFSSSADLSGYYRQLQRQATLAEAAPAVLAEGVLQARALGARVFLPLRRRRPVALRAMLVYVWVVCCLAMAWPSVLRTTGLISERAYILPVASLVEPLWTPYELDEPMVLEPARQPDIGVSQSPAAVHGLAGADTLTCPAPGGVVSAGEEPAPERRISRRQLLQTLDADTLPRLLVRWLLYAGARVSPHVSVSLAYVVWWVDPDLIVPLSPDTVDTQLGYIRAAPRAPPVVAFGTPPAFSEWYGMLRRLERRAVRLPQAGDGTPLVLRPSGEPVRLDQALGSRADALQEGEGFVQSVYSAAVYGVAKAAAYCWLRVRKALQRVGDAALARFSVIARLAGTHLQGTPAGNILDMLARGAGASLGIGVDVAAAVWEYVVRPLLWHASLALRGLVWMVAYAAALVVPAADRAARDRETGGLALLVGSAGVGSVVPSVFLAAFWDAAAAAHGNAALQRLRPELWAHVLGADTHFEQLKYFVYDAAPQPPPSESSSVSVSVSSADNGPRPSAVQSPAAAAAAAAPNENRQAVWTAMDWMLAAYRVVLGVLACRAVFGPSRSSRPFAL
ncbi:hypothetical protein GGF43_001449, partial [Coemansia sp. RSA 2618]